MKVKDFLNLNRDVLDFEFYLDKENLLHFLFEKFGKKIEVITHHLPHLDEFVAIWLIHRFAGENFFQRFGRKIWIGIGGGVFDEHSGDYVKGEKRYCTAILVAKKLERDPALKEILKFVLEKDRGNSQKSKTDVEWFMKMLDKYAEWREYTSKSLLHVFEKFDLFYKQEKGIQEAVEILNSPHHTKTITRTRNGKRDERKVRLLIVEGTDNPFIINAIHRFKKPHDVFILKNNKGNILILAKRSGNMGLRFLFDKLIKIEPEKWYCDGIPGWLLVNGNERFPREPTIIPVEKIIQMIEEK